MLNAVLNPDCIATTGLASSTFARRYSQNLFWFLFLWVLRCFSSPRTPILFNARCQSIALTGFPIRKSADQCLFTAPRSLSQLVTSFFGSWCQGIHLMLFIAWTLLLVLYKLLIFATLLEFRSIINFGLLTLLTCEKDQSFCIYLFELFHLNDPWIILANCSYPRFSWKTILLLDIRFETVFKHISFLKQFFSIICSFYSISCFIRFSMNICIWSWS